MAISEKCPFFTITGRASFLLNAFVRPGYWGLAKSGSIAHALTPQQDCQISVARPVVSPLDHFSPTATLSVCFPSTFDKLHRLQDVYTALQIQLRHREVIQGTVHSINHTVDIVYSAGSETRISSSQAFSTSHNIIALYFLLSGSRCLASGSCF